MNARKTDLEALRFAASKVDALVAASRGEESSCSVFSGLGVEPFSENQKRAVRLYVESWIEAPLDAAIAALEGERGWENEHVIDAYTSKGWHLA